jgi:hypothetical protein
MPNIQVQAAKLRKQLLTAKLGPNYLKFESMNVSLPQYLQFPPVIYQQLVAQMQVFNLGTDMIIAGVDDTGHQDRRASPIERELGFSSLAC